MKNTANFHSKIKVCISKVTVSEKIRHFQHMEVSAPRSMLVVHPPKAHTELYNRVWCCDAQQAGTSSLQAMQGRRAAKANRELLQAAGGRAKSQPAGNTKLFVTGTVIFFSILIIHLFRGFRLLRNTNPSWLFAFVSFHILVLVYCWTNGAQQIIMQKYTQYIPSKEKLFTKMFSPHVTCTYSSNHTGIKLI